MKRAVLTCLFFCMLSACAGGVTGKVYLDTNGNNALDKGEKGVSKAIFDVTLDGETLGTGTTDSVGNLSFTTGGKTGIYCVTVSKAVKAASSKGGGSKAVSSGKALEPSGGACVTDVDCMTGLVCSAGICKEEGSGKVKKGGACSHDTDCATGLICSSGKCTVVGEGGSCEADSDCASGLECVSGTCTAEEEEKETVAPPTEPFKACVKVTGYSSKETLNIPVVVNIASTITKAPQASKKTIIAGSDFNWNIYYPKTCKLLPIQLPEWLAASDKALGDVSLDISLLQTDKSRDKTNDIKAATLEDDDLEMITLELKALPFPAGKKDDVTVTISPQVSCPDGETYPLDQGEFVITKEGEKNLKLSLSSGGEQKYGAKMTLTATLKNNGAAEFSSGGTLTVTVPENSTDVSPGSGCTKLINKMNCEVTKLAAGAGKSFSVSFDLPADAGLLVGGEAVVSAEFEFWDGTESLKESSPSFMLQQ